MSRAGHPSGNWRGEICIYYKESLRDKTFSINYFQEYICIDIKIGSKRCVIVSLYKSPSQSADEFENFLNKLNLNMESIVQKNSFRTVAIGNFNARSSKRWMDDKTAQESLKIENLLPQFSLSQVVNKPTHVLQVLTLVLICCLQINKV